MNIITPSLSPSLGCDSIVILPWSADNEIALYPPGWENSIDNVSPIPLVNILESVLVIERSGRLSNNASIVIFSVKVIVIVELEEFNPLQPINPYPSLGVAVTVIDVPSSYVPPAVETLPPSSADTVIVYCETEVGGVVLVVFDGGET